MFVCLWHTACYTYCRHHSAFLSSKREIKLHVRSLTEACRQRPSSATFRTLAKYFPFQFACWGSFAWLLYGYSPPHRHPWRMAMRLAIATDRTPHNAITSRRFANAIVQCLANAATENVPCEKFFKVKVSCYHSLLQSLERVCLCHRHPMTRPIIYCGSTHFAL